MLTGFDSKWINTLYLDKVLKYENIIQAFSRTNRLFGPEKPFGIIRYYRKPATMRQNIDKAVELYSGNKPLDLFVDHLDTHLKKLNDTTKEITTLFNKAGVENFTKLPDNLAERGQFAKLFSELTKTLEAARIQGFTWEKDHYDFTNPSHSIVVTLDEQTYLTLALRYKELEQKTSDSDDNEEDLPFDIETHLTEIDTGYIDTKFMNSRFKKYIKALYDPSANETVVESVLEELHSSFATLTQEQQKHANIFLHDIQSGDAQLNDEKTFQDYITEYAAKEKNQQIDTLVKTFGIKKDKLTELIDAEPNENTLNEYGRFDALKETVDENLAATYFDNIHEPEPKLFRRRMKIATILKEYILYQTMPKGLEEPDTPN